MHLEKIEEYNFEHGLHFDVVTGEYSSLNPHTLGRPLTHEEMDYNLLYQKQTVNGYRIAGSNNDLTLSADDLGKVLSFVQISDTDTDWSRWSDAGLLNGQFIWAPVEMYTTTQATTIATTAATTAQTQPTTQATAATTLATQATTLATQPTTAATQATTIATAATTASTDATTEATQATTLATQPTTQATAATTLATQATTLATQPTTAATQATTLPPVLGYYFHGGQNNYPANADLTSGTGGYFYDPGSGFTPTNDFDLAMSYVMDNLGTMGNGVGSEYDIIPFNIPSGGIPALGNSDQLVFPTNDTAELYYIILPDGQVDLTDPVAMHLYNTNAGANTNAVAKASFTWNGDLYWIYKTGFQGDVASRTLGFNNSPTA